MGIILRAGRRLVALLLGSGTQPSTPRTSGRETRELLAKSDQVSVSWLFRRGVGSFASILRHDIMLGKRLVLLKDLVSG